MPGTVLRKYLEYANQQNKYPCSREVPTIEEEKDKDSEHNKYVA